MAYTIQDVHNDILFLIDKEQNGHVSHEEIDQALHIAQLEKAAELTANLGTSTYVNDGLSPFINRLALTTGDTTAGVVTPPTGFMKVVSLFSTVGSDKIFIEPITEEQLPARLLSQVVPISTTQPVYVQRTGTLQVYPTATFAGELIYVKEPVKPVFGYTQSGRAITYASGSSTQLSWRRSELNSIIYRAIEILGFNLNDIPTVQFASQKKNEG